MTRTPGFVALVITALLAGPAAAGDFHLLGYLPGQAPSSRASAVSADGSVVVGFADSGGLIEAFRWQAGVMTGLGFLDGGSPGAALSEAAGVSADGSVIVGSSSTSTGYEAFRWQDTPSCTPGAPGNACMTGLGFLDGAEIAHSVATGISADGTIIVGQSSAPGSLQGFRWEDTSDCDPGSPGNPCMIGLGDLPALPEESDAAAISEDGSVIVGIGSGSTVTAQIAVRWNASLAIASLGEQPDDGTFAAAATSEDGSVIVGKAASDAGIEAFRWRIHSACDPQGADNDCMQRLGDLDGGTLDSAAAGISATGLLVVGTAHPDAGGSGRAFIWDPAHGMRDLNDVVIAEGTDLGAWTLIEANAISSDGTTVVGMAENSLGDVQAYAITTEVPEPGRMLLLASGALFLMLGRKRDSAAEQRAGRPSHSHP